MFAVHPERVTSKRKKAQDIEQTKEFPRNWGADLIREKQKVSKKQSIRWGS